jgi:hypothetical protein
MDSQNVSHICLLEPSLNQSSTKKTAVLIVQAMLTSGISAVRFKALLSIFGTLLRWLPSVIRNRIRLLWHSAAHTVPPDTLRFQTHLRSILPSVRAYTYRELDCPVSVIYRNINEAQIRKTKQFWGQVVGHEVRVHSVEAGAAHLVVLEDTPLETIAAVIDKSLSEATLPKKDAVVN